MCWGRKLYVVSPAIDLVHMVKVHYWHWTLMSIWTEILLLHEVKLVKSAICLYAVFAKNKKQKLVNKIQKYVHKESDLRNNMTFSSQLKRLSKTYKENCHMLFCCLENKNTLYYLYNIIRANVFIDRSSSFFYTSFSYVPFTW